MTLKEPLEQPLRIQHTEGGEQRKQQIKQVMAQVNLAERFLGLYPSELSGGQRQLLGNKSLDC